MAKKKELTEEERLEQALVPESEWPYELPEGWKWVRLEDINSFTGKSIEPSKFPDEEFELYSVPSYDEDFPEILRGKEIGSSKKEVEKNDILLCKINPRINRVWIVTKYTEHRLIASSEWIHIRSKVLIPNYLMWYFRSGMFREFMLSNVSGVGGSLMRAQPKMVNKYVVPIAPIEKQLEIVKQIESLFSKLEEAKEKVESVLESSENRKSAILHKAFTGELTKKWREENGEILASSKSLIDPKDLLDKDQEPYEIPDSWRWSTLGKVCTFKGGGTPSKSNPLYWNGDIPWASIKDIKGDELFSTVDFITEEGLNNSSSNLCEKDNLILATRISPGKSIISRIDVAINQDLKIVETELNVEFLHYYFNSIENIFLSKSSGSTVQGINLTNVKNTKIAVPSTEEQIAITQIVKTILEEENSIEALCTDFLGKIEITRKVILSSIFRGTIN